MKMDVTTTTTELSPFPQYDIRAPCLYRILKTIYSLLLGKYPDILWGSLSEIDEETTKKYGFDENKILTDMYEFLLTHDTTPPIFPSDNMEVMGKAILKIIQWYNYCPEIYHKIKIMSLAVCVFSFDDTTRQSRSQEISALNENFHKSAKALYESTHHLIPRARLVTNNVDTGFHKDSQYLQITLEKAMLAETGLGQSL